MSTPSPQPPDDDHAGNAHTPHKDLRWPWIAGLVGTFGVGVVVGLVVPGAGPVAEEEPAQVESAVDELDATRLEAAKETCVPPPDSRFVEILDDGAGMSIDGVGAKKPQGAGLDQIECILSELGAPSTVQARMGNTLALDGTQDASWSSLRATWTYHPESGINVVIGEESST